MPGSTPCDACQRKAAAPFPRRPASSGSDSARSFAMPSMASSARRSSVLPPTPHRSFSATPAMNASTPSAVTSRRPSGFAAFVASLATNLFGPMPTVIARPASRRTSALRRAPVSSGGPKRRSVPVRSRNASSTEICCRCGVNLPRMSITPRDTSRYRSMRTGRNAACGQRRQACEMGMAECTPNFPGFVRAGGHHPAMRREGHPR